MVDDDKDGQPQFWNPKRVFSYNCMLNIVESPRGQGKTYGAIKYVMDEFREKGDQFAYIRRHKEDIKLATPYLFDAHEANGDCVAGEFRVLGKGIIHNEQGYIEGDDNEAAQTVYAEASDGALNTARANKLDKSLDRQAGIAVALPDMVRMKSIPMPRIQTILFEEYIAEDNRYLRDEVHKLLSIIESIARMRNDVRVLLLGNTSATVNPYYDYLGITPQEGSRFTHLKNRSCVIERFYSRSFAEKKAQTKFGSLIGGTQYGEFIINNKSFEDTGGVDGLKHGFYRPTFSVLAGGEWLTVLRGREGRVGIECGRAENVPAYTMDGLPIQGVALYSVREWRFGVLKVAARKGRIHFKNQAAKVKSEFLFKKIK